MTKGLHGRPDRQGFVAICDRHEGLFKPEGAELPQV